MISEGVQGALARDTGPCRRELPERFAVEIQYKDPCRAYARSFYPGARLDDDRTLVFETEQYFEVLRLLQFAL